MSRLPLFSLLTRWTITLAALAGVLALAYLVQKSVRDQRAAEEASEAPRRAANKIIKLGTQLAESHGLKDEPAQSARWSKRVPAYGRVVPNPRVSMEVRVALAGTLRADAAAGWPAPGSRVKGGQLLGWLDIRVGPQERLDLLTKRNEARLKQRGAEDQVRLQQERVDRFKAAGAGVSRAELDTAQVQLTENLTQVATAKAAVKEWQEVLDAIDGQGDRKDRRWSQPLTAPASGEITELTGHPGMALEPGAVVARLVDFRYALVRFEVPPEALPSDPPMQVELFTTAPTAPALEGASNRPEPAGLPRSRTGRLIGTASQVEVNSQFVAYWYEIDTDSPGATATEGQKPGIEVWRPGLFVKAFVPLPEELSRPAVSVPVSSLLYHQGRALVYVRIGPGRYERREVQVLGRTPERWLLAGGVVAGESVVSRRAQVLLSEEFRGDADYD